MDHFHLAQILFRTGFLLGWNRAGRQYIRIGKQSSFDSWKTEARKMRVKALNNELTDAWKDSSNFAQTDPRQKISSIKEGNGCAWSR